MSGGGGGGPFIRRGRGGEGAGVLFFGTERALDREKRCGYYVFHHSDLFGGPRACCRHLMLFGRARGERASPCGFGRGRNGWMVGGIRHR